jgi:hypothetical protein
VPKRRTVEERAEYFSAEEAAVVLGMHPRALKRRIRSGGITPPAKYREEQRYLFTPDELQRAQEELGHGKPLAVLEAARGIGRSNMEALAQIGASLPKLDMAASTLRQFEALGAQLEAGDELTKTLRDLANSPTFALQRSVAQNADQLNQALRTIGQMPSTANWAARFEEQARWMHGVAGRRAAFPEPVSAGQVEAFPDEDVEPPASLDDVLAELRQTNILLRDIARRLPEATG